MVKPMVAGIIGPTLNARAGLAHAIARKTISSQMHSLITARSGGGILGVAARTTRTVFFKLTLTKINWPEFL